MRFHDHPPLPTLDTKPSWHNRADRTDRSACAELRPKDILPQHKPGRSAPQSRVLSITLSARRFAQIHDKRLPYQLAGDRRTTKSNAMRTHLTRAPTTNHAKIHEPMYAFGNPNKGAPRTKFLGLWYDWKQTIKIERRPRNRTTRNNSVRAQLRAPVPYFICPMCERRVKTLFLPLCTRAEATDADIAERWLNALETHYANLRKPVPPELLQQRAVLITRYGPLFRPDRQLRCRHCWHVRYGGPKRTPAP